MVCDSLAIPTEVNGGPFSVDARVILVDHSKDVEPDISAAPKIEPNSTTIPDLATFAAAYHPWDKIFHVNSEAGAIVFKRFCNLAQWKQKLNYSSFVEVPGGIVMNEAGFRPRVTLTNSHRVVCLGGTFDYLHPGHKLLLTAAVQLLDVPSPDSGKQCRFVIGITGDALLVNKKFADQVQTWQERTFCVLQFLATILELSPLGFSGITVPAISGNQAKVTFRNGTIVIDCVEINDVYGPTITDPEITALVVSGETKNGGNDVLVKRQTNGLGSMELFVVDVLDAKTLAEEDKTENFESKISSTAIRKRRAERATGTPAAKF